MQPEPVVKKSSESSLVPKETEKQLSNKERKKKELAELDALLADFGVSQKENNGQGESSGKSYLLSAMKTSHFLCNPFFSLSKFF